MNRRTQLIIGAVVVLVLAVAAYAAFMHFEAKNNRAKIVGTWAWTLTGDDVYEGIVEANAIQEGARPPVDEHAGHNHAPGEGHDDEDAAPDSDIDASVISEAIMGDFAPDGLGQALPEVRFEQTFREDGTYTLRGGVKPFEGTWTMPDANGKTLTAVVRLVQTEEVTQRLVMWIRFIDNATIEVADEVGTTKTFLRVP